MRMIDTVSLKLFVTVCEEKSIELASQKEGIVRSAVSKRISAMEDIVGAKLLERLHRGVEITPAGRVLERYAREILNTMERIYADLKTDERLPEGHVRVAAAMSTVDNRLLSDISRFLRLHDKITVSVTEKLAVDVLRAVDDGRADVGICWDGKHTRWMNCIPYQSDEHCLVVRSGHKLAGRNSVEFSEILDYDLIEIAPGCLMWTHQHKEAAHLGKTISSRIQVNTFNAALRAISDGLGIAVMPVGIASGRVDFVEIPILDSWSHRQIVLITKEGSDPPLATRLFIEELCPGFLGEEAWFPIPFHGAESLALSC